ncbi:hypothetical protein P3S67_016248 [Capsicum chacoense]
MMTPLPSISKAYSMLQHDEHQKESSPRIPSFSNDSVVFLVFTRSGPQYRRGNTPNYNQRFHFEPKKAQFGTNTPTKTSGNNSTVAISHNNANVSCEYCKKFGHVIEDCYRLHGFPADFSSQEIREVLLLLLVQLLVFTMPSFLPGFTKDQYQYYQYHLSLQHNTPSPEGKLDDNGVFSAFAGLFNSSIVNNVDSYVCAISQLDGFSPWILDSGATNHMTPHKHLLHDLRLLHIPQLITLPNGYKVKGPSLKRPL